MAIEDVVTLLITANTRTPTRQGFGNCLLLGHHTHSVNAYDVYRDTSEMIAAGFSTAERVYRMAAAAFAQNPRPPRVLVGRLATPSAQSFAITVLTAVEDAVVSLTAVSPDGTETPITYTVGDTETTTTVATALELLIEAVTGVDSSSSGAVITATPAVAGAFISFHSPVNCAIKDNSSDTGYVTALGNVLAATKDFYFVCTDHNSETIADAVAAWAETNDKVYVTQSNDSGEAAGTGTFGSGLKAAGYAYTPGLFVRKLEEYGACRMAALGAVRDPGSFTWHLKELRGLTPVYLTGTQQTNLDTAGWNYYTEVANGINGILANNGPKRGGGISFGGTWLDQTHGTDWLKARLQEGVLSVLANADKVDYDDGGALTFVARIKAILSQAEDNRLLRAGESTVGYGAIDEQDPDDRANRYFPALNFGATYRGAMHAVRIVGTIDV